MLEEAAIAVPVSAIVAAIVYRFTRSESIVVFALIIPLSITCIGVYWLPTWLGSEAYGSWAIFILPAFYVAAALPSLLVLIIGKALKRRPTIY